MKEEILERADVDAESLDLEDVRRGLISSL